MKISHYAKVPLEDVNAQGAANTKIRWLISQADGAPNFALRMFEVEADGHTPLHSHDWEHEVFILEGEGVLVTDERETSFKQGDVIYVDPNMMHQFKNTGKGLMRFLCIIPHENNVVPKKKAINPFAAGKVNNC